MVFVSSLTPPEPKKTTPFENLCAQPHRLFFFAGIIQGLVYVAFLALSFSGWFSLKSTIAQHHAYAMTFLVFTQFFAGFLLTVFPRYLSSLSVEKKAYMPIAGLINGGSFVVLLGSCVSEVVVSLGMLIAFAGYLQLFKILLGIQQKSKVENKRDTFWILTAFSAGCMSQLLFIALPWLSMYSVAIDIGFFLYLFFVVLVVSQKMMPFFASNVLKGYTIKRSRYFLEAIFGGLTLKVALHSLGLNALIADALLLGVLLYELIKWRLPFREVPAILWVLSLSVWWAVVAFALFVAEDISLLLSWPLSFEKAPLHALALGYFTTVLIGFGTRVVLGHSGRTPKADGYIITIIALVQVMTLLRVVVGIFSQFGYMHMLFTVCGLWVVIFGLWSKRHLLMLFEK